MHLLERKSDTFAQVEQDTRNKMIEQTQYTEGEIYTILNGSRKVRAVYIGNIVPKDIGDDDPRLNKNREFIFRDETGVGVESFLTSDYHILSSENALIELREGRIASVTHLTPFEADSLDYEQRIEDNERVRLLQLLTEAGL